VLGLKWLCSSEGSVAQKDSFSFTRMYVKTKKKLKCSRQHNNNESFNNLSTETSKLVIVAKFLKQEYEDR